MADLISHFGYLALTALLLAGGVGVPVPEELIQLTAGALCHEGLLRLRLALPVIWVSLLAGDTLLFLIARRHGPKLLASAPARRFLTPARYEKLQRHYDRHAFLTVAVARHLGGLRFPAFVLAGASRVPLRTFLAADGLSATLSVPLVVGAGYVFWEHLTEASRTVRIVEGVIVAVVVVAVIAVVLWRRRRGAPGPAAGEGSGR